MLPRRGGASDPPGQSMGVQIWSSESLHECSYPHRAIALWHQPVLPSAPDAALQVAFSYNSFVTSMFNAMVEWCVACELIWATLMAGCCMRRGLILLRNRHACMHALSTLPMVASRHMPHMHACRRAGVARRTGLDKLERPLKHLNKLIQTYCTGVPDE